MGNSTRSCANIHSLKEVKVTNYGHPELDPLTTTFPLRTVNGVAIVPPIKQRYGCYQCERVGLCEMVLRMHGRFAVLPCEGVLVSEITGEILFGLADVQDGEDDYYKVREEVVDA